MDEFLFLQKIGQALGRVCCITKVICIYSYYDPVHHTGRLLFSLAREMQAHDNANNLVFLAE